MISTARPGAFPAVPFGKPLAPFVKVLCAIDSEHSMAFASAADLTAWGVTDDEALRTASANLARMPCQVRRDGPVALVQGPDGYVSSWLAAPAADHPRAAAKMLEPTLEHCQAAARQLSPVPYLVSEAGIEPWTPPPGHPARPVVDKAVRYLAAVEYREQKAMLDDPQAGEDAHVAKHTLMRSPDGHSWSYATWVRQVTNGLLPQADVLMLEDIDHPGASFAVRWDDVLRLASDALQEEASYDPPRWRHRGWPDDKTLALLRAIAVPDNSLLKAIAPTSWRRRRMRGTTTAAP